MNPPALGQAGDGLIHHRLVDAGGHVLLVGPLIEKGLDIRLGEDPAAAGDGIDPLVAKAQLVHLVGGDVQKGGHLVNKSSGTPGAGAIHPLVYAAVEEDDLGVLAPQFDNGGGIRLQLLHHLSGGEYLLHKGQADALRQSQPRGAGEGGGKGPVPNQHRRPPQKLQRLLAHLGHMALVLLKQDILPQPQHHLDSGTAHVDAEGQRMVFVHNSSLR